MSVVGENMDNAVIVDEHQGSMCNALKLCLLEVRVLVSLAHNVVIASAHQGVFVCCWGE